LANFTGANGANPSGALIMDASGDLYGTTMGGGANNNGAIFELPSGGSLATLASFNYSTTGSEPQAALVADASGNLYGTATYGGANSDGTVFEYIKSSGTLTALASFTGTNGANPQGALVMDAGGNLYGTAYGGGANGDGTVFEVANASGAITTLATFNGTNGGQPSGGLILDGAGNLYGTTRNITGNYGTIFEWVRSSNTISTLATFNSAKGSSPRAGLLMDASGNMYGTTFSGGTSGNGAVFGLYPQIQLTSPTLNGNASLYMGGTYNISWSGGNPGATVQMWAFGGEATNGQWVQITPVNGDVPAAPGYYGWYTDITKYPHGYYEFQAWINPNNGDPWYQTPYSPGYVHVVEPANLQPILTFTTPTNGQTVVDGNVFTIQWTVTFPYAWDASHMTGQLWFDYIDWKNNNNVVWTEIANLSNTALTSGTYSWNTGTALAGIYPTYQWFAFAINFGYNDVWEAVDSTYWLQVT
jgi:uncharacterized repeat protein (TIGR03803 family)